MKGQKVLFLIVSILFIISAAVVLLRYIAPGTDAKDLEVIVTVEGKEYTRLPLLEDEEIRVDTSFGYNDIVINDGCVYVSDADCPNGVCVDTGKIKRPGEVIACIPHRLIVEIVSGGNAGE